MEEEKPINKTRPTRKPAPIVPDLNDSVNDAEEWIGEKSKVWIEALEEDVEWAGSKFETAHNVVGSFMDRVRGLDNAEEIFMHWFADAVKSAHEDVRKVAREHRDYLKSREAR